MPLASLPAFSDEDAQAHCLMKLSDRPVKMQAIEKFTFICQARTMMIIQRSMHDPGLESLLRPYFVRSSFEPLFHTFCLRRFFMGGRRLRGGWWGIVPRPVGP